MLGVDTIKMCDGKLVCNPQGTCVECLTATDCSSPDAPYCSNSTCVAACASDQDCVGVAGKPFCAPTGACVECVRDAQCSANAPVCDATSLACRGCVTDDECGSAVCDVDTGECIAADSVLYARPSGTDVDDCSQSNPCSLAKALAQASALRSVIRMLPGVYSSSVSLTSANPDISIIGSGATLAGDGTSGPALSVGGSARIAVRALTVDVTGGTQVEALSCSPAPGITRVTLQLRDTTVLGGQLLSSDCDLTMIHGVVHSRVVTAQSGTVTIDRSLVSAGLLVGQTTSGPVSVTNSILGGVTFLQISPIPVTMTFDTFFLAGAGATLPCSISGVLFEDDIVLAPNSTNAVTGTACQFANNLAFPQATNVGTGTIRMDPLLVNPANGDFHLQAFSPAIDAADSTPDNLDFDGTPRPQGTHADLGAFEFHP